MVVSVGDDDVVAIEHAEQVNFVLPIINLVDEKLKVP